VKSLYSCAANAVSKAAPSVTSTSCGVPLGVAIARDCWTGTS
jgi:hypothetical protein